MIVLFMTILYLLLLIGDHKTVQKEMDACCAEMDRIPFLVRYNVIIFFF
jgi:hypothetical protein